MRLCLSLLRYCRMSVNLGMEHQSKMRNPEFAVCLLLRHSSLVEYNSARSTGYQIDSTHGISHINQHLCL